MKRLIVGTAFCGVIILVATVIAVRWSFVFWLLAMGACPCLVFGRRDDIEFRIGIGNGESERRLCAALVWKRSPKKVSESQVTDFGFDAMKVENRV